MRCVEVTFEHSLIFTVVKRLPINYSPPVNEQPRPFRNSRASGINLPDSILSWKRRSTVPKLAQWTAEEFKLLSTEYSVPCGKFNVQ